MKPPTLRREKIAPPPASEAADRELLRSNLLLLGISDFAFERFSREIKILRCASGEIIFKENDRGNSLYLIARGAVRISKKGRGGRQETLAALAEGDFFGEMALVDNSRRSAQATAQRASVLGRVDRRAWELLLTHSSQEVLSNFTHSFTQRLRSNNQHFIAEVMRSERLSLLGSTISSVAHDINNPLSSIISACDILRETKPDKLVEQLTGVIRDSVDRMQAMTRELIEFSRGDTRLDLFPTPIKKLLEGLEYDFQRCRELNIDVRIETLYEGKILLDRRRMERAFTNLIRNARDAMPKNGGGIFSLRVERRDNSVLFTIADNGRGIPAEILPRIFEPFVTHGKAHGTGLGLAIAKALIEMHGGSIKLRSQKGPGTTFEIKIPTTR